MDTLRVSNLLSCLQTKASSLIITRQQVSVTKTTVACSQTLPFQISGPQAASLPFQLQLVEVERHTPVPSACQVLSSIDRCYLP